METLERERARGIERSRSERGGGGGGSWYANTCHGRPQQKHVGYVDL